MGSFGGYYKGERRKQKKAVLEQKAQKLSLKQGFILPDIEIIKKGKK
jgi:hypothetical protein